MRSTRSRRSSETGATRGSSSFAGVTVGWDQYTRMVQAALDPGGREASRW
jgi:hypothetical protein